jgi:hypothetical protein
LLLLDLDDVIQGFYAAVYIPDEKGFHVMFKLSEGTEQNNRIETLVQDLVGEYFEGP